MIIRKVFKASVLATALALASCSGFEGSTDSEGVSSVQAVTSLETLQQYATKCEDATGIRIPAFSCENGYEVPQGTVILSLMDHVIGATWGQRTLTGEATILEARGSDIGGSSDQFYFSRILTSPTGDGAIEVQVTSLTNTHEYAKAGVMFRANSTALGAPNVMMAITPSRGAIFQYRLNPDGPTVSVESSSKTVPSWLRLVREGPKVMGFVTADRVNWTKVGEATISNLPLAGLALTSHNTSAIASATFDRFRSMPKDMTTCDRPNVLAGKCDPGSRFQVLAQNGDAAAVAICRKGDVVGTGRYGDIAVIQYNKVTGGLCFYQAQPGDAAGLLGTNIPAPIVSSTAPDFHWVNPGATRTMGCPKCHDNGAFIRSPYLVQTGLLPNAEDKFNNQTPVRWVGADFAGERSWGIDTAKDASDAHPSNCNQCHRLSVNNFEMGQGTAANFSKIATASDQELVDRFIEKNPHSPTSPIWMRRGQIWFEQGAYKTASKFSACANGFWGGQFEHFTQGTPVPGCTFTLAGQPWIVPPYQDMLLGITSGTRTANGTVQTVQAAGKDIYGLSDEGMFSSVALAQSGVATVKVNSLGNTHPFAKAGIMLRSSSYPGSGHVMVHITPSSGAQFQYRPSIDANVPPSTPLTGRAAPAWLRLYRNGPHFSGWVSNDGITWNQVAPAASLPLLPADMLVGLAVTSHVAGTPTTAVFDRLTWLPMKDALMDANIGQLNGTRTLSGNNRIIQVAGSDIYNDSDQFFFSFKQLSGTNNKEITAKINSIGATHAYAKAGVMLRSSLNPNASHVLLHVTPSSGVQFQLRTADGLNVPLPTTVTGVKAPIWLRLVRTATGINGLMSPDNKTWTQVGTTNAVTMPDPALYGVAVTSHAQAATTASVSNVVVDVNGQ